MNKPKRCWLYHGNCKKGKIFEGDQAIEEAIKDGWVDSPAKVKKPGRPKGEGNTDDDSK